MKFLGTVISSVVNPRLKICRPRKIKQAGFGYVVEKEILHGLMQITVLYHFVWDNSLVDDTIIGYKDCY